MSMRDKARVKVKDILANYKVPPLEKDVQKKIDAIIEKAKKPMWGGESKTQ
jgi:trimethylamine:corrinoid methyltransferase-like protein